MSLIPSFHYTTDLSGSKSSWIPFKNETEYRDQYDRQKAGPPASIYMYELGFRLHTLPNTWCIATGTNGTSMHPSRMPSQHHSSELLYQ